MFKLEYVGPVCGVNKRYGIFRGRMVLSMQYREFVQDLTLQFLLQRKQKPGTKKHVSVSIQLWIPDKMDSDAPLKPIFDALQHAGIHENDNQIRRYHVEKTDATEPRIMIEVREIC